MKMKKLKLSKYQIAFIAVVIIFLLLKIPAIWEPEWYIDEGIYSSIGNFIHHGALLYKDTWDNKPPSIYFLFFFSRIIWGFHIIPLKILIVVLSILSFILFYRLLRKWFVGYTGFFYILASLLFVRINNIEGTIVNAELFFTFFTLASLYLLQRFDEEKSKAKFFFAGLSMGIGISFKMTASFDAAALIFVLGIFGYESYLQTKEKSQLLKYLSSILMFILGCFLPLFLYAIYFYLNHGLDDFIQGTFLSNSGYVSTYNNSILGVSTVYLNSIFAIISSILIIWLYLKRKVPFLQDKQSFFIMMWLIFALYGVFLSGRPYTHYLIQLEVPASIVIAYIIYKLRTKGLIAVIIIYALLNAYFIRNVTTGTVIEALRDNAVLYIHSYQYAFGVISEKSYLNNFYLGENNLTANAPREVANYTNALSASGADKIYLWGNLSWVDSFTTMTPICKYINNFDVQNIPKKQTEIIHCLDKNYPKVIVDENSIYSFPDLNTYEQSHYNLANTLLNGTVRIYVRK